MLTFIYSHQPNKGQHRLRNFVTFIAKSRNKSAKITPLCGRRYMTKMKKLFIFLLLLPTISFSSEADLCQEYISQEENYKTAHNNKYCLAAAEAGSYSAQYQLGMSYGFAGNTDLEEKYYKLSAYQGGVAAFLALGHLYSDTNIIEAIYWYELYAKSSASAHSYAALLLSKLHHRIGNYEESSYWIKVCKQTDYKDNCILNE